MHNYLLTIVVTSGTLAPTCIRAIGQWPSACSAIDEALWMFERCTVSARRVA